jgi:hypothetical protein
MRTKIIFYTLFIVGLFLSGGFVKAQCTQTCSSGQTCTLDSATGTYSCVSSGSGTTGCTGGVCNFTNPLRFNNVNEFATP